MNLVVDSDIELRSLELSDVQDMFQTINAQREYLGKWLPFIAYTKEMKDTEAFVRSVVEAPKDKFEHVFTIRENNLFVGLIGFKDTDRLNHKTEIGYWLSEHHQKKGIITRSVSKLCQWAFDELGMNRIQIKCAVGNMPSKNIPIKLGFRLEGIERQGELLTSGEFTDLEVYSKLKTD